MAACVSGGHQPGSNALAKERLVRFGVSDRRGREPHPAKGESETRIRIAEVWWERHAGFSGSAQFHFPAGTLRAPASIQLPEVQSIFPRPSAAPAYIQRSLTAFAKRD